MSLLRMLAPAVLVACAACGDTPVAPATTAGPQAAVVKNEQHIALDYTMWGCNEPVNIKGVEHIVVAQGDSLQGAGRSHSFAHVRSFGTGVGLYSGSQYTFSEQFNYGGNWDYADSIPSGTSRSMQRWRLVSRDTMPDLVLHFYSHVTVRPDGTIAVNRYDWVYECR